MSLMRNGKTEAPLYDLLSEMALLGSIILDEASLGMALAQGVDLDWFTPRHADIFRVMVKLRSLGCAVDLVTLSSRLADEGMLEKAGGAGYIASLVDGVPMLASAVREYIASLRGKRSRRRLLHAVERIRLAAQDQSQAVSDAIEAMRKELDQIEPSALNDRELFVPGHRFAESVREEIEWTVTGVMQKGCNGFIAGVPKGGKSWLAADLAIALSTGRPWLGFDVPKPIKTALISREDNPSLTGWRLRSLCYGRSISPEALGNLWVNSKSQSPYFRLDNPTLLTEMILAIKRREAEVVILDVMNVLHGADENDAKEMRQIMDALARIQAETGAGICVLHHFRKAEGTLTEKMRGSSAIAGFAEYVIGIERRGNEGPRRVSFDLKSAASPDPMDVTIQSEGAIAYLDCQRAEAESLRRTSTLRM